MGAERDDLEEVEAQEGAHDGAEAGGEGGVRGAEPHQVVFGVVVPHVLRLEGVCGEVDVEGGVEGGGDVRRVEGGGVGTLAGWVSTAGWRWVEVVVTRASRVWLGRPRWGGRGGGRGGALRSGVRVWVGCLGGMWVGCWGWKR